MTLASIFHFELWFIGCRFGLFFGCLLEAFASYESVFGTPLGVIRRSLGSLFGAHFCCFFALFVGLSFLIDV